MHDTRQVFMSTVGQDADAYRTKPVLKLFLLHSFLQVPLVHKHYDYQGHYCISRRYDCFLLTIKRWDTPCGMCKLVTGAALGAQTVVGALSRPAHGVAPAGRAPRHVLRVSWVVEISLGSTEDILVRSIVSVSGPSAPAGARHRASVLQCSHPKAQTSAPSPKSNNRSIHRFADKQRPAHSRMQKTINLTSCT